ncbi:MAG: ion transporter [Thermodesulfobacteriota bacterium]|nr:MAG: ion transporter [Thermodesulfobacteriota bacterium]
MAEHPEMNNWKDKIHEIIFEADTPLGKLFDEILIVCILASVLVVMLDSVESIGGEYSQLFYILEWFFTIIFTIEYILRLISVKRPAKYATSFFGIVDLLTVIPTYLDLFLPGTRFLLVIRILRVLRIFRILKLAKYVGEANLLIKAIKASSRKITIFLFFVISIVVVLGSLMYIIEGSEHGFTSIPKSIYWAIVTLTTVGYGDVAPQTSLGQAMAVVVMIMGYSIIAVPTGIVTVEMAQAFKENITTKSCQGCSYSGHDSDAKHCKYCGSEL